MYGVIGFCLLFNIWEMFYLGFGIIRDLLNSKRREFDDSGVYNYFFIWNIFFVFFGYNIVVKLDQIQYIELFNVKIVYK